MSARHPEISIVTVVRNGSGTISRALASLVMQGSGDFESVVVDGASTDGTLDIVAEYKARLAAKGLTLSVVSEPDNGIYDAMNKGIARCQGEIIGTLNADDWYEADALDRIHAAAAAHPDAGVIYGALRQVLEDGQEVVARRYNFDYLLTAKEPAVYSAAQHPACFVRRAVYQRIGVYDTSFRIAADYDFLLRAKRMGVGFLAVDAVIATFTLGGASGRQSESDNLDERWRARHQNGLLTDTEYRRKRREVACRRLADRRRRWLHRLLRPLG